MYNLSAYPPNGSSPLYPAAVPIQAPYPQQPPPQPPLWSSGLCGCAEDCSTCLLTFFCPWITFGRVAEIVDEGRTMQTAASMPPFIRFCVRYAEYNVYSPASTEQNFEQNTICRGANAEIVAYIAGVNAALYLRNTGNSTIQDYPFIVFGVAGWVGPMPSAPPMASGMYR